MKKLCKNGGKHCGENCRKTVQKLGRNCKINCGEKWGKNCRKSFGRNCADW